MEGCINEVLPNPIIRFLKVNFKQHPLSTLAALHGVDDLLGDDNVIRDIPPRNKANLLLSDDN